jgi:hypothetical protein
MSNETEKNAGNIANLFRKYVEKYGGSYLLGDDGSLSVVIGGHRILLNFDRENTQLATLMLSAAKVTTLTQTAQVAIQRIRVHAHQKAARMKRRSFSFIDGEGQHLYIPLDASDGKVLRIAGNHAETLDNGSDGVWVEHPSGDALQYKPSDPGPGLKAFERLLVDTQACARPEMRWLVAMQLGLFPYFRDLCSSRFLSQLQGPSQTGGKTTGAQRFTLLHGLGSVKGDFTVAALQNEGDIGLLVLDNKEQANFTQPLTDFCLFLATGAEYGRSSKDGTVVRVRRNRPVCVLTTIEGVAKRELQTRTVTVDYRITGPAIGRMAIEREIAQRRHEMLSAFVPVFQRFLQTKGERQTPVALPNFQENFESDADLLRSFAVVAGKDPAWAEQIIAGWVSIIEGREIEESELEHPICRVVEEGLLEVLAEENFAGRPGKLYVTTSGGLLTALQKLLVRDRSLPTTPEGLGRRLRSQRFCSFDVVTDEKIPALRRRGRVRPIGLFFPADPQ